MLQISIAFVLFALAIAAVWRGSTRSQGPRRRRFPRVGPGTVGTIYDMLNEDKRKAVEIIVEQRAAERRPEYPDGNLPDLESPGSRRER